MAAESRLIAVAAARSLRPRRRTVVAGQAAAEAAQFAPQVEADPTAAAFFDVDNTVLRGASIFYLGRALYRQGFFGTREVAGMAWAQAQFLWGAENLEHMNEARSFALTFIQGRTVAELSVLTEQVFDEVLSRKVWPGTQALTRMHLEEGQRVWLVTAAPVEIATVIAAKLGLTGAMGTVAEHIDGVYTGRLVGEVLHGQAKAEAVAALARREGLDLARCAAYSDSSNDIPMLSLVGDPCAINPDRQLRAVARERGWRIRDYRRRRRTTQLAGAAGACALVGVAVAAAAAVRGRQHGS
jgi:HAD superfamily hydrolase (TIGR01490 family)